MGEHLFNNHNMMRNLERQYIFLKNNGDFLTKSGNREV